MDIRKLHIIVSRPASYMIPLEKLISLTRQNRILPFYHSVSDQPLAHLRHVINIRNLAAFRSDLDFFLKYFKPIDANELIKEVNETVHTSEPVFHLSFDDGLKECITVVAPILKSRGVPSTFFINSGFIGNRDIFYRFKASLLIEKCISVSSAGHKIIHRILNNFQIPEGGLKKRLLSVTYSKKAVLDEVANAVDLNFREYAEKHDLYLSEVDIEHLLEQGFTIGTHSIDHPAYASIDGEEQVEQTNQSLKYLVDRFRISPLLFSFPFSDESVSASFFHRIHKPEGKIDLSFGISGLKLDILSTHLHRIPMEVGSCNAKQIITGEFLYFLTKSLFNKNKIHRK
jgi:peptidoglycan/xylan/chitin deacetylase (PgdA/CDA1 family)